MDLVIKLVMLIIFFGVMIGIGLYCRKHATDVNGFVLGGRSVGPWLTAFAYGTSYFSAVVFVGYAGQFGWNRRDLGGTGERVPRFPACLGGVRSPYPYYDTAFRQRHHAAVFRRTV